ncbi:MAG: hypothetical protein PGN13_00440 [Patulibacter minatonensis]
MTQVLIEQFDDDRTELARPYWRPLLELVGDLAAWFAWRDDFRLEDGRVVHEYQHLPSGKPVFLGLDGQAYEFLPSAALELATLAYSPITRVQAIDEAFLGYRGLRCLSRAERDDLERRIDLALDHAEQGRPMCAETAAREMRELYAAEYGDLTGPVSTTSPLSIVARS